MFEEFVKNLDNKDVVYISKVLCGDTKASKNEKSYMQVGMGVNPNLFKDKGTSIRGLLNSNVFLVVVPKQESLSLKVYGDKK